MSTAAPRGAAGSALVEALVALVLLAIAGLIVATAAVAGLRATRRAATVWQLTAVASRELAAAANVAAMAASGDTTLAVSGFPDPVACHTDVERADALVRLTVRVDGGRPAARVTLATRVGAGP